MVNNAIALIRDVRFRGKLRLCERLVPKQGEKCSRVFGYNINLDLSDDIQRWIYVGCFEPEETDMVRAHLKPGMTFLDVGANVGYFTLLAASLLRSTGRIYSVEPSPSCSQRLANTVNANKLANVKVERIGLSDEQGVKTLHIPPADARNHSPSMIAWPDNESTPVDVPVRTLDEMLSEWNTGTIDLMKMDVEGHEPAILRGARRALESRRIRALLCEFNAPYLRAADSSSRELYDTIIDAGFRDVDKSAFQDDLTLQNRFFTLA